MIPVLGDWERVRPGRFAVWNVLGNDVNRLVHAVRLPVVAEAVTDGEWHLGMSDYGASVHIENIGLTRELVVDVDAAVGVDRRNIVRPEDAEGALPYGASRWQGCRR